MSRNKTAAIALGLVLVAGVAVWMRFQKVRDSKQVRYDTAKVDRGRIVARVTASGALSAIVTVQVGTQVSGTIAALHADFNSTVKKGQLVTKIDPRLFEAAVQQARANVIAAQGNFAKVKAQAVDSDRQAKRSKELAARQLIAQADYETAQATADANRAGVDAAVGTVEQAKAQLHQAEVNLAYTDIRSPTNGTVISRNVDVGQTVAASLQAPTLFLIAEDLQKMQVDTSVAEADIGKLTPGMRASFSVDAYPTERFVGKVRQVRNAPQTLQNVVTYDAVIDVDNSELKLRPGMTANCTFIWAQRDEALRVPNAAMRFRPPTELQAKLSPTPKAEGAALGGPGGRAEAPKSPATAPGGGAVAPGERWPGGGGPGSGGGRRQGGGPAPGSDRRTVWVLRDGKPQQVNVHIGVSDGSLTEVVEGDLKEGDAVITDVTVGDARPASTQQPGAGQGGFPRRGL
jgi:HlyD family secretion protein